MSHHCYIIPPHILQAIAESEHVDDEIRACALRDLEHRNEVFHCQDRSHHHEQEGVSLGDQHHLAAAGGAGDGVLRMNRTVYDAAHSQSEGALPGKQVRAEGEGPVADKAVNQAYDNVGLVLQMYSKFFKWNSIDNKNMPVKSSVHFGKNYQNAFWDPSRRQMVFGDGGGLIYNFTAAIDVIGHELTHAVTEHTSPLIYQGQSGALNESMSDVFGIMIKQWHENEKAVDADWLIGEECLVPGVKGVALRSMANPGTAYDDKRFGKDPQPASFTDYVVMSQDNGGVHIYSGIPNKAFCLAAKAFGGYSWEKAGQIWWKTMRGGKVPEDCDFQTFANITIETAQQELGDDAAKIVRQAWETVNVLSPGAPSNQPPANTGDSNDNADETQTGNRG